jgi:hypothetical protein
MAVATRHPYSRVCRYATYLFAAGLSARRVMENVQRRRCAAWSAARLSSLETVDSDGRQHLVLVVPMYQEQEIAGDAVAFWHMMAETADVDEVVFVTTAKEHDTGQPTTQALLEAALADTRGSRLRHLHCTVVTRFRAAQLNLAVSDARDRYCRRGSGKAGVWIGIYNADSRPEASTFRELQQRAYLRNKTRAYQQLARYVVPDRPGVSRIAVGNAALQTWWTCTHYWARNTRGSGSPHWWACTSPYSTFGHGEFVRLDLLDEIGGFPDFAYADGLLLGWILRLMDEPIGLLASADHAEVPRTGRDLLTQQRAWMQGLLNFGIAMRWTRDSGRRRLAAPEAAML